MCNPMLIVGAAATGLGAIREGVGQRQALKEESASLEYQAAVARDNALAESQQIRRDGARARGTTIASAAAAGVKIGEGSTLDAERQVVQDTETDAALSILNGEREARGLQAQAFTRRRAANEVPYTTALKLGSSLLSMGSRGAAAGK